MPPCRRGGSGCDPFMLSYPFSARAASVTERRRPLCGGKGSKVSRRGCTLCRNPYAAASASARAAFVEGVADGAISDQRRAFSRVPHCGAVRVLHFDPVSGRSRAVAHDRFDTIPSNPSLQACRKTVPLDEHDGGRVAVQQPRQFRLALPKAAGDVDRHRSVPADRKRIGSHRWPCAGGGAHRRQRHHPGRRPPPRRPA